MAIIPTKMKIAFVTTYDAKDVKQWSGLGYYIAKALSDQSLDVYHLGPLKQPKFVSKLHYKIYNILHRKKKMLEREPVVLESYARQVEEKIKKTDINLVFSPGTVPISFLETKIPIVFWTDATFAGMLNFYPCFTNLSDRAILNGNRMEQAALARSRLAIYSSDWATNSARNYYDVDNNKLHMVPFGANFSSPFTRAEILRAIRARSADKCRLLFIGGDWFRKGGDYAIQIAARLNQLGVKTELSLVGDNPKKKMPYFVKKYGFISKATNEGEKLLAQLFLESHFLILPSLAECAAVVLAEANSFGLPALASDVGGNATIIRNGNNGFLFASDDIDSYCDYIEKYLHEPQQYFQLAQNALGEYEGRLNWKISGEKVKSLLIQYCF